MRTNILKNKSDQSMETNYQISRILNMTRNPNEIPAACNKNTRVHRDQTVPVNKNHDLQCWEAEFLHVTEGRGMGRSFFSKARDSRKIWRLLRECRSLYIENDGLTRKASKSGSKLRVWKHSCGFLSFHYPISKSQTFCNTSSICSTWLESSAKHVRK